MTLRKPVALLTMAAPLALIACGGGEKQETPAAGPATTQAAAPAGGGGGKGSASVSGKVSYAGTAPAPEKIKGSAAPYCQKEHRQGLERQPVAANAARLQHVPDYVKSRLTSNNP